jgi:hypothetical protein
MRFLSLSLLAICLFGSVAAATCSPIPGAEQLWSRPKLRWLIVGELHGSNETPAAFLDLVCDALEHGKRVTVALERSSSEQELLDRVLTDPDSAHAVKELLRQRDWREVPDGRSSEAMLHMILALRDLHRSHPQLSIFAFDTSPSSPKGGRDKAMGKALLSLRERKPNDFILVLVGNAHASEQPVEGLGYDPTAAYLPADGRISLEVKSNGGETWAQTYVGKNITCGPINVGTPAKNQPRGIVLDPKLADFDGFDGILSLGIPTTASAPAVGELTPLPDCRKQFMSDHEPTKHDQSQTK